MSREEFMQAAIERARAGIEAGQTPFGAVIVQNDHILAAAHNTVWRDTDPTAHAEVNAIREAALKLSTIDLGGCNMYTTCEPCPMCLSAIHWAKIDQVFFGATIADASAAGFSELHVPAVRLASMGGSPLQVYPDLLSNACRRLFQDWKKAQKSARY